MTMGAPSERGPSRVRYVEDAVRALDGFLRSRDRLEMPAVGSAGPAVAVVLVTYGKAELTFACLQALARTRGVSFEVVVVDNASTDRTGEMLACVDGIRVILNERNEHFLAGANRGAAESSAPKILFLNNDTEVDPDAIGHAVSRLDRDETIGIVGGRLVFPDGSLQEAGAIVWRDGACSAFGRGFDPGEPEFAFVRDVDYVSGAFLMIDRGLWESLGGFDSAYSPAYYEDVDLCLRAWQAGRRVVYEPRVSVRHLEFGSSDRPESALELQRRNQVVLSERHRQFLARQRVHGPSELAAARFHPHGPPSLLFVDECVPHPAYGAGYPRALRIVEAARAAGWFVSVLPLTLRDRDEDWASIHADVPDDVEVLVRAGEGVRSLDAVLEQRPGAYDAILVSRSSVMEQVNATFDARPELIGDARLIADLECVQSMRLELARRTVGDAAAPDLEGIDVDAELALTARAHAVTTPSPREVDLLRDRGMANVHLLGHGIEVRASAPGPAGREGVLFIGAVYSEGDPNGDSIFHFVRDILPKLHALGVGPRLTVAGPNETGRVFEHPEVEFLGRQEDLTPLYDRARVFIAPTRMASGIPLKVIEAAAHGVPVVCTELLRWQLGWTSGDDLLAAPDADGFAEAVAGLIADDELWTKLQAGGFARVRAEYGPDVLAAQLMRALTPPS